MEVRRGDVWQANLGEASGSGQGCIRPVIVIQNDVGNRFSPTVIAIPLTSKQKNGLPTHGTVYPGESGLEAEAREHLSNRIGWAAFGWNYQAMQR